MEDSRSTAHFSPQQSSSTLSDSRLTASATYCITPKCEVMSHQGPHTFSAEKHGRWKLPFGVMASSGNPAS
ncbi:hypothetical protein RRG08_042979 [Elysia crispata]|uniref:Uncharacterized protein n=1 Tax=Elysia crispata TaxID=231223 RepID=A0AAE1B032_9GAST|nr:hypothetical protein RRG08_042979 [Elysia crispata]